MANTGTPYLSAAIIPCCGGSAIVGEFRKHKAQVIYGYMLHTLISAFFLGIVAFVAYGVYRDPSSGFTLGLAAFICCAIVIWVTIESLLRKHLRILPEDLLVVTKFIEGALNGAQDQETEQAVASDGQPLPCSVTTTDSTAPADTL